MGLYSFYLKYETNKRLRIYILLNQWVKASYGKYCYYRLFRKHFLVIVKLQNCGDVDKNQVVDDFLHSTSLIIPYYFDTQYKPLQLLGFCVESSCKGEEEG